MKTKYSFLTNAARGTKQLALLLSVLTVITTARPAWADSPSELLEQGIYSEESKGDLDSAMQLYQQVITQGKNTQALAAQAQYRIGVCYFKKQKLAEANAAFEAVVKDYPDQKDLVALARDYLGGNSPLQPAPWVDGEEMRLDVKLAGGLKIGVQSLKVSSGEINGQKIWRISSRMSAGGQSYSQAEVDAESFKPIHSRWKHTLLGDVDAAYAPDHADLKWAGKDEVKKLDLAGPVIDNEECLQWMRCLPLAGGYKTSQKILASLSSRVIPVTFTVSGPESVTIPSGTYNCYKVDLSIAQTFWYTADAHRYLVKFEAGGAIAELQRIPSAKPAGNQEITPTNPQFGYSLKLPAGWFTDPQEAEQKNKSAWSILDPEAMVTSAELDVQSLDSLKAENSKSPRQWGETKLDGVNKMLKNFTIRADGWQERTIAGQPAVSVISDFEQLQSAQVLYGVFAFVKTNAVHFELIAPAKDFDTLRPQFDAIVDSYKTK